jgi:hypothetical protein
VIVTSDVYFRSIRLAAGKVIAVKTFYFYNRRIHIYKTNNLQCFITKSVISERLFGDEGFCSAAVTPGTLCSDHDFAKKKLC